MSSMRAGAGDVAETAAPEPPRQSEAEALAEELRDLLSFLGPMMPPEIAKGVAKGVSYFTSLIDVILCLGRSMAGKNVVEGVVQCPVPKGLHFPTPPPPP